MQIKSFEMWRPVQIKDKTIIQRYLPKRIPTTLAAHRQAYKSGK